MFSYKGGYRVGKQKIIALRAVVFGTLIVIICVIYFYLHQNLLAQFPAARHSRLTFIFFTMKYLHNSNCNEGVSTMITIRKAE